MAFDSGLSLSLMVSGLTDPEALRFEGLLVGGWLVSDAKKPALCGLFD